jgi:hypothetical protein
VFCDLLAHAPLSLVRNVSLESVREFKVVAFAAAVADALRRLLTLTADQAGDAVRPPQALAGALFQIAAPGTNLHAV